MRMFLFIILLSSSAFAQLNVSFNVNGKIVRVMTEYQELDNCNEELKSYMSHPFQWPCLNLLAKLANTLTSNGVPFETFINTIPTLNYTGVKNPWSVVRSGGNVKDKAVLLRTLKKGK